MQRLILCGNVNGSRDWRVECEVAGRLVRRECAEVKRPIVVCEEQVDLWREGEQCLCC